MIDLKDFELFQAEVSKIGIGYWVHIESKYWVGIGFLPYTWVNTRENPIPDSILTILFFQILVLGPVLVLKPIPDSILLIQDKTYTKSRWIFHYYGLAHNQIFYKNWVGLAHDKKKIRTGRYGWYWNLIFFQFQYHHEHRNQRTLIWNLFRGGFWYKITKIQ